MPSTHPGVSPHATALGALDNLGVKNTGVAQECRFDSHKGYVAGAPTEALIVRAQFPLKGGNDRVGEEEEGGMSEMEREKGKTKVVRLWAQHYLWLRQPIHYPPAGMILI